MEKILLASMRKDPRDVDIRFINDTVAKRVINFHKSFPQYEKTPLVELAHLSNYLGIKNIFVKDESYRFGLNAFKVLGGSFAIGSYIADRLGMSVEDLPYERMISKEIKEKLGEITFATATDGNHGRGVAWTANQLKQKSKVFMPKGTARERLDNIRAENADADIYEYNYDECVRLADEYAKTHNGILVQDTSWEGYEDIPRYIMQGYMTMAYEAYNELKEKGSLPTHIFLQAGVGSLASAVTGFFANVMKDAIPTIVIVEPHKAACLYQTAKADDGKLHPVTGDMDSIMAGLNCGEPVTVGWPILKKYAHSFLSVDDCFAAHGMRLLGNPLKNDKKIISGESGAVTAGVVSKLMTDDSLKNIKEKIGLDSSSIVLCFSTEGDTDKDNYLKTVWDGKDSSL
ncbi:diaminopropionate ammonia-lyase [Treponema phagedenis]|uniref:Diaminopropionate ammonia-lyase n=1 Tax=Treponema phagedenis TaxID=162 RepID=A0A0B7GRS5_TREPH|nr:diaminopropionate ammonia-lyase [Treponema phagedenis]NVP24786.1 diaminopropionate ammonia-lyase [Treponema phagedenis]QEJ95896.1 diaminopropionate ammonia-lyase [Treponema phagedenis]QEJ98900.1 diaminopropionate ammonia-lyase [Treponema phagedenis]QEK00406.1 diaminopropionate ammonia-lyase [Treponema phagedenis]QEK04408.1 diaminopropionate ammonia-lyase [Treponema phagedenis]